MATVGPSLLHDVALATQHCLALEAAKVFHVPVPPLGFGAFVGEDDLEIGKPNGEDPARRCALNEDREGPRLEGWESCPPDKLLNRSGLEFAHSIPNQLPHLDLPEV